MYKFVLFVILIFYESIVFGKRHIPIGIILEYGQQDLEIAFRTAIDRFNVDENNFQLTPVVEYTNTDDSYVVEKIVCSLISEGSIAIFGPSSKTSNGIVSSICNLFDIPHIQLDWTEESIQLDKNHKTMTVNIFPDNKILAEAYADIINAFKWRGFVLLYDSDDGLIKLQNILQTDDIGQIPFSVHELNKYTDYRSLLKSIKSSGEGCIILECSTDKILWILRQAKQLNMIMEYRSYFLSNLDAHTIDYEEIKEMGANITTVQLYATDGIAIKDAIHDWTETEKIQGRTFTLDENQIKIRTILLHDGMVAFLNSLKTLRIGANMTLPNTDCAIDIPWPVGRRFVEYMKEVKVSGISGMIAFNRQGQRTQFELRVSSLQRDGFQQISKWSPDIGITSLNITRQLIKVKLQQKNFIIASRLGEPFLMEKKPKDGEYLMGNARYEGYSMDLISALANELGFSFTFEIVSDGKYGSYHPETKKWDGIIGYLVEGKADLGICDLTITYERRKAVDFTTPFMTLGISILYTKPIQKPPDFFSFLKPYEFDVWLYMATAYLAISILLFVLARMAPCDWENPHPCIKNPAEVENIWRISNTTWLMMGSLMGQGCDILPKSSPTRIVTGMWWFFALMMLNSYTANLAAFLTMSRMEATIESAEDLAKQNKIKYGTVKDGSTMGFFKESNHTVYQKMWAAMENARPSVFTRNNEEGRDRVLKGKRLYAFLMESTNLQYITERYCELRPVGSHWLDTKYYGIALPFGSPYRTELNKKLLEMSETSRLKDLENKWWKKMRGGGQCPKTDDVKTDTAGIDNLGGVFLILGIGILVAFLIGISEFLWNVQKVAVRNKITLKEAFMLEFLFAVKFWLQQRHINNTNNLQEQTLELNTNSNTKLSETF